MIQWLLDAGHPATVIAKRTGHRDIQSLHSYNHLQSQEGYNQQLSLFVHTSTNKRFTENQDGQRQSKRTRTGNMAEVIDLVNQVTRFSNTAPNITLNLGNVTYEKKD